MIRNKVRIVIRRIRWAVIAIALAGMPTYLVYKGLSTTNSVKAGARVWLEDSDKSIQGWAVYYWRGNSNLPEWSACAERFQIIVEINKPSSLLTADVFHQNTFPLISESIGKPFHMKFRQSDGTLTKELKVRLEKETWNENNIGWSDDGTSLKALWLEKAQGRTFELEQLNMKWHFGATIRFVIREIATDLFFAIPIVILTLLLTNEKLWFSNQLENCEQCGYDMRATPNRCPECGFEQAESEPK